MHLTLLTNNRHLTNNSDRLPGKLYRFTANILTQSDESYDETIASEMFLNALCSLSEGIQKLNISDV